MLQEQDLDNRGLDANKASFVRLVSLEGQIITVHYFLVIVFLMRECDALQINQKI